MPETNKPTVDFDHHSPEYVGNAHAILKSLRDERPVAWTDRYDGFWILSTYEDVYAALRNGTAFSSERIDPNKNALTIPMMESALQLPLESDGPDFQVTRRIVSTVLSPAAIGDLGDSIDRWTSFFLDELVETGDCDFIYDYAMAVPACVTLEWLGLPTEQWRLFSEPLHDAVSNSPGSPRFMQAMEAFGQLYVALAEMMAARRNDPKQDVLSYIVSQQVDDAPIDDRLAFAVLFLLLAGGIDTTTSLTGSALVHLQHNDRDRALLLSDPSLLDTATDEFLRVYPSLKAVARTVITPVEVRGCRLEEGERVLLSIVSANFDEAAFPAPDEVQMDRFPNRHLSFAVGMHRCAGSHFARAMFKEMVRQALMRLPDYAIDTPQLAPYPDAGVIGGWAAVPASFSPGKRLGTWAPDWSHP